MNECPRTWIDAQSAARRWCTKPYGVSPPVVGISGAPSDGFDFVTAGDGLVGRTYYYDAASGALVAVFSYDDASGTRCLAGALASAPSGGSAERFVCAGAGLLDAGAD